LQPMGADCGQRSIDLEVPYFNSLCLPAWNSHEYSSYGLLD
jgi:hypothetical protein